VHGRLIRKKEASESRFKATRLTSIISRRGENAGIKKTEMILISLKLSLEAARIPGKAFLLVALLSP